MSKTFYSFSKPMGEMVPHPDYYDYSCVMQVPKEHVLKSETYILTCEVLECENFSINDAGEQVPGGIKFQVFKPMKIEKL